jgi:hypothetical protein
MNLLYSLVMTAGLMNGGLVQYEPYVYTEINNPVFFDIDIDCQLGPLFVAGGIRVDMWMNELTNYCPYQNTYDISTGLRYGPLEIGLQHSCFHPSAPYMWMDYQIVPAWEGAETSFYARLKLTNR